MLVARPRSVTRGPGALDVAQELQELGLVAVGGGNLDALCGAGAAVELAAAVLAVLALDPRRSGGRFNGAVRPPKPHCTPAVTATNANRGDRGGGGDQIGPELAARCSPATSPRSTGSSPRSGDPLGGAGAAVALAGAVLAVEAAVAALAHEELERLADRGGGGAGDQLEVLDCGARLAGAEHALYGDFVFSVGLEIAGQHSPAPGSGRGAGGGRRARRGGDTVVADRGDGGGDRDR